MPLTIRVDSVSNLLNIQLIYIPHRTSRAAVAPTSTVTAQILKSRISRTSRSSNSVPHYSPLSERVDQNKERKGRGGQVPVILIER